MTVRGHGPAAGAPADEIARAADVERPATTRRVVVVTGASAGVGRAIVREVAEPGVTLALLARGPEGLDGARADAEGRGAVARAYPVDVADPAAVDRVARAIEDELGAPDVWINDAMVTVLAPAWEVTVEELRRVTDVNYLGAVYGTLAALRTMRPRNAGTIVQIGSALAYRSIPLQSAYCASKFALRGFTDSLRTELMHEKSGVRVTMVHLPALNTPQFGWCRTRLPNHPQPVPPIFQPEVAARAVREAIARGTREVFCGWPAVQAIVGNRIAPWFADRVLAKLGFAAQQTEDAIGPDRRDNLFEPIPGDHGAHGAFDARARPRSRWDGVRRGLLRLVGRNGSG